VVRGVGIGLLPIFQAHPFTLNGSLEEVLPQWEREPVPVHAVYPSSLFLTSKVRAFVDEAVLGFAGTLRRQRGVAARRAQRLPR